MEKEDRIPNRNTYQQKKLSIINDEYFLINNLPMNFYH